MGNNSVIVVTGEFSNFFSRMNFPNGPRPFYPFRILQTINTYRRVDINLNNLAGTNGKSAKLRLALECVNCNPSFENVPGSQRAQKREPDVYYSV